MNYTQSQLRAIEHDRGNLLVFAVAGSGKTTVLVEKIKRWAAANRKQLVLAFNQKAAGTLLQRVGGVLGAHSFIGTFHSFCLAVTRKQCPTLYAGRELMRAREDWLMLKWAEEILKRATGGDEPALLSKRVGRLKTYGYHPAVWGTRADEITQALGISSADLERAAQLQEIILKNQKYTFDDMLVDCLQLLDRQPERAVGLQQHFDHVLVDEFQDTDPCQAKILKHITNNNLCVVGDDDQSIYQFRGCSPQFIMNFEQHYGPATKISMEENFRSEDQVLVHANKLIHYNKDRVAKTLITTRGHTGEVTATEVDGPITEACFVADIAKNHVARGGRYADVAVLYRTNAQSGPFEDAMAERQIPFEVVDDRGGFYGRTEIKTLVNYLRLIHNPYDLTALRWVLNRPNRYLRSIWVADSSKGSRPHVVEVLKYMCRLGSDKQGNAVLHLQALLESLLKLKEEQVEPHGILLELWNRLDYTKYLTEIAARSLRPRSIDEYQDAAARFVYQTAPRFFDLKSLLQHIDLVESESQRKQEGRDAVLLTTVHRAKGMEFPVVAVVGLNEDLFPHQDAPPSEERRLAYVAVTRAIHSLHLVTYDKPSSFFSELGIKPLPLDTDDELPDEDRAVERLATAGNDPRLPGDTLS